MEGGDGLVARVALVDADDHGVVTLVRLEGELLLGLDALLAHVVDLGREDLGGGRGRVDTVGLDRDDDRAALLQEVVRVERNDTRLVGLRDVGEDDVDHLDEHAVLLRVARVLDDGDHVRALLRHADQVTARAVRELDSVDNALGADDVRDVRDGGSRGGSEVEDLGSGLDLRGSANLEHIGSCHRYRQQLLTWMASRPPRIPAASLERKGFQTRYSTFSSSPASFMVATEMRFSP